MMLISDIIFITIFAIGIVNCIGYISYLIRFVCKDSTAKRTAVYAAAVIILVALFSYAYITGVHVPVPEGMLNK